MIYEVVVDRVDSDDPLEYEAGASFYFNSMADLTDFLEICFKSNKKREHVLIRIIEDK